MDASGKCLKHPLKKYKKRKKKISAWEDVQMRKKKWKKKLPLLKQRDIYTNEQETKIKL